MLRLIERLLTPLKSFKEKDSVRLKTPLVDKIMECERLKKLGNQSCKSGDFTQAEYYYKLALEIDSEYLDAHMNLGWLFKNQGNFSVSQNHLLKVLSINPDSYEAYYMLGGLYESHGDFDKSLQMYEEVRRTNSQFHFVYNDLARVYLLLQKPLLAQKILETGLTNYSQKTDFHFQLGDFFLKIKKYKNAFEHYQIVLQDKDCSISPYAIYVNMAITLKNWGKIKDSIDFYQKALAVSGINDEQRLKVLTSLIFMHYYVEDDILPFIKNLSEQYGQILQKDVKLYNDYHKKGSKIRIGFVSGDFRSHPVAMFSQGIFKYLDKSRFELVAYSTSIKEDSMTQSLKPYFHEWNIICPHTGHKKIHEDGIDILIDLAGHTADSGLNNFAFKPAPIQLSWIGFFGTTGLKSMDYLLCDELSVKKDEAQFYCEKIKYLPVTKMCFVPQDFHDDNYPNQTPALKNGFITFGCYQNIAKITDDTLIAWKKLSDKLPTCLIRFQISDNHDVNELLKYRLVQHGITRFQIVPSMLKRDEYMASYSQVDILLDTFPYTGATTTCEGLYMGVPSVTIKGKNIVSRQCASILNSLGLDQCIAINPEDYIHKAIELSSDITALNDLRQNLRQKFLTSLAGNPQEFTQNLEKVLIEIYNEKNKFI